MTRIGWTFLPALLVTACNVSHGSGFIQPAATAKAPTVPVSAVSVSSSTRWLPDDIVSQDYTAGVDVVSSVSVGTLYRFADGISDADRSVALAKLESEPQAWPSGATVYVPPTDRVVSQYWKDHQAQLAAAWQADGVTAFFGALPDGTVFGMSYFSPSLVSVVPLYDPWGRGLLVPTGSHEAANLACLCESSVP